MFLTSTVILKPGGFSGSSGTPNYLQSLDAYCTQVQWTEAQIGAMQSGTLRCKIPYVNVMDIQAGNWVAFGCYGGTTSALSAGATSLVVNNCTDDLGNQHLIANDSILVTDGVNAEIFKAASVSYSGSTATITLGAAASQSTTSLLNAYSGGAKVTRLQWQGMITGRKRTTDLSNVFDILVQGMMWRYAKVIGDFDIVSQDSATSISKLASMYVPQVPEVIYNAANFASANGIIYSGTGKHATIASIISDILKTESGGAVPTTPNEATYWAFWVDELRQAHHQQVTTQATGSATYSLDLIGGSVNVYPHSDTLSDSTLSGLTLASGGPSGATDAEYPGTGVNATSSLSISRLIPVMMGSTYTPSWLVDMSQVTHGVLDLQLFDINGTAIEDVPGGTGPGLAPQRFAGNAWTCPTNLVPNSDSMANTALSLFAASTGGPGGATDYEFNGTGANIASNAEWRSQAITVTPGETCTPTFWCDPTQVAHGGVDIRIINAANNSILFDTSVTGFAAGGAAQRYAAPSFVVPAGVTSIYVDFFCWNGQSGGFIVANGQKFKISQPMLEPAPSASGYYISNPTPQVKMQLLAWNGQSGGFIVANGQKFKISQPMLTARAPSGDWDYHQYVPWHPTNAYGDVLGPVQPQDMDMTRLLNCVLVEGGKDGNGNVIDIVLTVKPSYTQWGYYEGYLSNPNITDQTALATWAAGQVGVLAWPQQTGKLDLRVDACRLTSRDLLQVTGFDDGSTLLTNPTSIQHTADMKSQNVTASVSITQQQPNFQSVMAEIANEKSIRAREINNSTNVQQAYIVSGCVVSTSGLNWSTTAGVVQYNGTQYQIPAQSGTMVANDTIRLGVQVAGTPPGGFTLPCVDPMPNFLGGGGMQRMNAFNWFELQNNGGANMQMVQQTNFQGVYLATLTSGASSITISQRKTPWGGIGGNNLKPPTGATPSVTLNSSSVTAEGAASAMFTFSATVASMTFDDTIKSIDVAKSIAGQNKWGPWTPVSFAPANGTVSGQVHGLAAGQGYDIALQPRGQNGQALGSPLILGTSPTVSASAVTAAIAEWNEFGGTLQSDGSWTNVDGKSSATQYALATGQPFTVSADIAKGATANTSALYLGNQTNGYFVDWDGSTPGNVVLGKYVGGVRTGLSSTTLAQDTNYHSFRLTITAGSPNSIEASIGNVSLTAVQDSSLTLTSGTWPVTLYTGGSAGKVQHYIAQATADHYGKLPPRIQPIVIPPWASLPGDGSPFANGVIVGRHFSGAPSSDTATVLDGSGLVKYNRHATPITSAIQSTPDSDSSYITHGSIHSPHIVFGNTGNSVDLDTIPDGRTSYARVKGTELSSGTVKQLNDGTNIRTAGAVAANMDSSGNSLLVKFPSGKLQSDGSLTNVSGQTCKQTFAFGSGNIVSAEGVFKAGSAGGSNTSEIFIGPNSNNGYSFSYTPGTGAYTLGKTVSGTFTTLASGSIGADLNAHTLKLTINANTTNFIEGSVDTFKLSASDGSVSIGSGSAIGATVFTCGNDGSLSHWKYAVGQAHYSLTSTEYQGNFDSSGNAKSSTMWKSKVINSIANLTSNITVQFYSSVSGSLAAWVTSTINTSKSLGGTNQPDWEYPDGSGGIFPGSVNGYSTVNGTSQSAPGTYIASGVTHSMSWSGLGNSGVYILIGYNPSLDYYTVPYGPSATAPTDDVIAAAQGDGTIVVALISASSNTIVHTGGGGGQPIGGGGGRPRQ